MVDRRRVVARVSRRVCPLTRRLHRGFAHAADRVGGESGGDGEGAGKVGTPARNDEGRALAWRRRGWERAGGTPCALEEPKSEGAAEDE